MFNFTTTTLINSTDSFKVLQTVNAGQQNAGKVTEVSAVSSDYSASSNNTITEMQIHRGNLHIKAADAACYKAYKKGGENPVLAKSTLTVSEATANTIYRLFVHIKLEGSQNSYYANSTGFRGKPFAVEAVGDGTAANLAAALVANAKKYMIMVYENATVNVTNPSGASVVLEATDEYQRFDTVELQKWVPSAAGAVDGEWQKVSASTVVVNNRGKEGFGTYTHLMKDYRLPTAANTRWNRIVPDEAPVPGVLYDQFTVYMTKDRGIMGGHAVGQLATSTTCHVYFVQHNLATQFENALKAVGVTPTAAPSAVPDATADPMLGMISVDKAVNG